MGVQCCPSSFCCCQLPASMQCLTQYIWPIYSVKESVFGLQFGGCGGGRHCMCGCWHGSCCCCARFRNLQPHISARTCNALSVECTESMTTLCLQLAAALLTLGSSGALVTVPHGHMGVVLCRRSNYREARRRHLWRLVRSLRQQAGGGGPPSAGLQANTQRTTVHFLRKTNHFTGGAAPSGTA